jgi:DNA-binding transcriptional MerR regulator
MAISPTRSREIQLFDPPPDAVYTIEATSHLVNVSRRTILVYCKHHLLSPARATADNGYYFDRNAIRGLRRIEVLRTVCGDDFAGIKIILDLTAALEQSQSDLRLLSREAVKHSAKQKAGHVSATRSRRNSMKSNPRRK